MYLTNSPDVDENLLYEMKKSSIILGRKTFGISDLPDADFTIVEPNGGKSISRHHARISYTRNKFILEPMRQESEVDDYIYESGAKVPLHNGSIIRMGSIRFLVKFKTTLMK